MSSASPPRHSPTMMRSGRMRSELRTRSRIEIVPLPSKLGGRGLGRNDVLLVEREFGRVFDRDDALGARDKTREDIEEGRLSGAGAAAHYDVEARLDHRFQVADAFGTDRAEAQQIVHREAARAEPANRQGRAG